jgi:uncharacterized protein (DUF1800 family)
MNPSAYACPPVREIETSQPVAIGHGRAWLPVALASAITLGACSGGGEDVPAATGMAGRAGVLPEQSEGAFVQRPAGMPSVRALIQEREAEGRKQALAAGRDAYLGASTPGIDLARDLLQAEYDVRYTGLGLPQAGWSYLAKIEVLEGTSSLSVKLEGGTGNADLYVLRVADAVGDSPRCAAVAAGNRETCTIVNPVPGTYLVEIFAAAPFSGVTASASRTVSAPRLTDEVAARFLGWATFGPTDATIAAVKTQGIPAWIDAQIRLPRPVLTHVTWLGSGTFVNDATGRVPVRQVHESALRRYVGDNDQLRLRVAFALSQVFSVNAGAVGPYPAAAFADLLEKHALGNYRQLLQEVTYSAAMGRWLNANVSSAAEAAGGVDPDENYARELMQLFTLGLVKLNPDGTPVRDASGQPVPSYGDDDVAGLARVFTGLRETSTVVGIDPTDARQMQVQANLHEKREKKFLGLTIPAGTAGDASITMALDHLFRHPNMGPFVGRQLIQRLVTSNPSPAYVRRVAAVFDNNGAGVRGDLAAVVRAILTDPETSAIQVNRDPEARFGKLREPVLRMTAWMRALNASSTQWKVPAAPFVALRQLPHSPPSVFNFFRPGYVPVEPYFAQRDLVLPEMQIVDETTTLAWRDFIVANPLELPGSNVLLSTAAWTSVAQRPADLQAKAELLLAAGRMGPAQRKLITDAIAAIPATRGADRIAAAIALTLASPEHIVQK